MPVDRSNLEGDATPNFKQAGNLTPIQIGVYSHHPNEVNRHHGRRSQPRRHSTQYFDCLIDQHDHFGRINVVKRYGAQTSICVLNAMIIQSLELRERSSIVSVNLTELSDGSHSQLHDR